MRAILAFLLCAAPVAMAQGPAAVRILLGANSPQPQRWDGSVSAQGGTIASLDPWRFEGADSISGTSWKMASRPPRVFNGAQAQNQNRPSVPNGVIVQLSSANPSTTLKVTTEHGNFEVALSEIPYGAAVRKLDGAAVIDRVPAAVRITETPGEEDYPAAVVDKNGDVWLAYLIFRHHPDHVSLRRPVQEPLTNFSNLKAPPGGDQVFLRHLANGAWSEPIAVSAPGGDLYRPALAIDGQGRAWVFWSQNTNGNFDLFARPIENGKAGRQVQISKAPGSDVFPVAATDSAGKVWVAWQGWRDGRAAIFASTQNGSGFSAESAVSQSTGNEWNPAIAAGKNGRVTVAWDSYRNGNYDIYMRTAVNGAWQAETPVAASARYEAYPSIAYDPSNRLWVAYEEGGKGWGKDFGAYSTTGISLYQARLIRIRGFETDGRAIELSVDAGTVLPGASAPRGLLGTQNESDTPIDPNPQRAKNRQPNQGPPGGPVPKNTMPRLSIDSSGRMWLAFRSANPVWWTPMGTVWTEHAVSFDGARWTQPIFLTHSDNVLDNRPAVVSPRAGELMVLGSSDGRRRFVPQPQMNQGPELYNNDLWANTIALGPAATALSVVPAKPIEAAPAPDPAETAAIKRVRDFRSQNLRVVRGEFHRHSEISADGGGDGSILDQWRYILDAGALDWVGCCDHDNGQGREYSWWTTQKLTDIFYTPGRFVPMFSYERSVAYPEGHRNVIFAQRGIRTLPRAPITKEADAVHAPDTQMLYAYLKTFNGVVASHTSGTTMGTDWRDNDPLVEPLVEIYQGDRQNYEMPDAPRSNSADDSIGGWRPKGFINLALERGYKLAFEASSDHVSTHISYANILVKDLTRESVLDGLLKRHVYAATDNILADVRSGVHMMGDAFTTSTRPSLDVKLSGTSKFAKVHIIKDNNYVYAIQPNTAEVSFTWMDNAAVQGKTSYYYVRGEQDNGEIVWLSPMWITYTQ